MDQSARTWLAFGVCSSSVFWLGFEAFQRISKPRIFDEKGRIEELSQIDPKVGSRFPVPGTSPKGRTALLWVGDCNACNAKAFSMEEAKAASPQGTKLILIAPPSNVSPGKSAGIPTVHLSDRDAKSINAFFAPRVYILNDGKLTESQHMGEDSLALIRGRT